MENWLQRLFLSSQKAQVILYTIAITFNAFSATAADIDTDDPLKNQVDIDLVPEVDRRSVKISDIDTENFEIGIAAGLMSVEDFETNALVVACLTYHMTEDFFVEARYGATEVGETSFDKLSGGATLLPSDERDLRFYDLSLGINLFPGEAFIFDRWAVNSGFYLIGGVGGTDFAGNQEFTANAGVGYRIIATDFLALNFLMRDHIFETEITGENKTTHNFEVSAGFSFFF